MKTNRRRERWYGVREKEHGVIFGLGNYLSHAIHKKNELESMSLKRKFGTKYEFELFSFPAPDPRTVRRVGKK